MNKQFQVCQPVARQFRAARYRLWARLGSSIPATSSLFLPASAAGPGDARLWLIRASIYAELRFRVPAWTGSVDGLRLWFCFSPRCLRFQRAATTTTTTTTLAARLFPATLQSVFWGRRYSFATRQLYLFAVTQLGRIEVDSHLAAELFLSGVQ